MDDKKIDPVFRHRLRPTFIAIVGKMLKNTAAMANTYTQLYVQIVFAVRGRQSLISGIHREEIQKYITGIVQARDHKMLAVFCMPDHVHLLIGIKPTMAISDLVRDIKAGSSKFISDQGWVRGRFSWQEGFGAFSYSRKEIDRVINYIHNQEEHHATKLFQDEYVGLLSEFGIPYEEKYLFEKID